MATSPFSRASWLRWLCLAPIPLLWCLCSYFGWLGFAENKTLDWRLRFRGEREAPVKIIYLEIDDKSLEPPRADEEGGGIGGWPWNREHFARVCRTLVQKAGVRCVGLDIVFSNQGQPEIADSSVAEKGNRAFARYLFSSPPVVLGASYTANQFSDNRGMRSERHLPLIDKETIAVEKLEAPELPAFEMPNGAIYNPACGFIDTLYGDTRLVPLFAPANTRDGGNPYYFHLSLELVRLYLGVSPEGVKVSASTLEMVDATGSRVLNIPLLRRQLLEVNWFTRWQSSRDSHYRFSDIWKLACLAEGDDADIGARASERLRELGFKDAIVLVGASSKLLQDLGPSPFDVEPVPKVGVHGNTIKTMLSGKYLHRLPTCFGVPLWEFGIIIGLSVLTVFLALAGGRHGSALKIAAFLLLSAYAFACLLLFSSSELVLPLVVPLAAAFSTAFPAVVWQVVLEEKQKSRIKGMFSTYLSPTVVQNLVESGQEPELGGHDAEITAYFSDIQSFSSFSEVMSAAQLTELLNEYLSACTDIVQGEGGTLDKYIGDAVVAMFGAPVVLQDHAFRACVASQLVHQRLGELRNKWKTEGEKWPALVHQLQTRIGLNTGVCMIGNMGSHTRFNYTMMGDNVNLAARMESGAKSWGVYTLCTEATRAACEKSAPGKVLFRPLGRIVVKGRSQAVPIHEIMGLEGQLSDGTLECKALFSEGLQRMYAQDWAAAQSFFERSAALEPNQPGLTPGVKTNASLVRLEKIRQYLVEAPPKNWDGVEVMTEK